MTVTDLEKSLPPLAPIPDAIVRRSAVHEAGHTLVGLALGMSLEDVTLMDTFDPSGPQTQVGGGAVFRFENLTERTRQEFCDRFCPALGGVAAEDIMLGTRGAGGGGDPGSDLHVATLLALRMEASYGLGRGLAYFSSDQEDDLMMVLRTNPDVRRNVNQTLDEQFRQAREILEARRLVLERLILELYEKRSLSADDVSDLIEAQPRLVPIKT